MQLFIIALLALADAASIIGIDFGTDWLKIGLVKPGVPLDIVLNKESKRKSESIVTIRDGIRYAGSEAVTQGLRRPQDAYPKLKNLLGRLFKDDVAKQYRDDYDNTMLEVTKRLTCGFQISPEVTYTVEELTAILLSYGRQQAESFAGEKVRDAIVTVPPFWNQHERQAFLDAAEIAGLNVIRLINDETAGMY